MKLNFKSILLAAMLITSATAMSQARENKHDNFSKSPYLKPGASTDMGLSLGGGYVFRVC